MNAKTVRDALSNNHAGQEKEKRGKIEKSGQIRIWNGISNAHEKN
jgi:hypothetical protein